MVKLQSPFLTDIVDVPPPKQKPSKKTRKLHWIWALGFLRMLAAGRKMGYVYCNGCTMLTEWIRI